MSKRTNKTVVMNWRGVNSLRGVKSALTRARNSSEDGATCEVPLGLIATLIEVLDQAIHTEEGHEVD